MKKAILWDLDGTLLNTLPDLTNILNTTLREFGFPTHTEEEVRWYIGNGVAMQLLRALPEGVTMTPEMLARQKENYLALQNRYSRKYAGIDETVSLLSENGIKQAIVSNKMDSAVQEVCRKYFPGAFDFAIGERDGIKKPDPRLGTWAGEALNVALSDCVYIGDSDTDLETAAALGIPCISAGWGFRGREFLEAKGALHIADRPADVISILSKL